MLRLLILLFALQQALAPMVQASNQAAACPYTGYVGTVGTNTGQANVLSTLTGRIAWERMISDRTMFGYFIGGELSLSDIAGAFEGDNRRLGVTLGGTAGGSQFKVFATAGRHKSQPSECRER